ncbi:MAG: ABC transporter ATP-binding protein, partial [Clostridia bacterium]|nr:ABC transporter ATP-binding protein [Clostridia bacterium]
QEGVLSTYAQENLTGVRVVRAFGKERYERDKFEKQNVYYTNLWVRLEKFMALYWSLSDFIAAVQLMFIIVIGTVYCVRGELTAGKLVEFVSYNAMMIGPVRQLGRIISNLSKASVSLGRIAEVMNAEEETYGEAGPLSGDIVFDNVSFEYETGKPVLDGVSFTVPQGSTLGIIGGTGSGKSTVACLMDGLYAPTSGRITIGGRDLTEIPPATLRRNVGFVMQEGYIYSRTIAENIAIAVDDGSAERVAHAAETACLDGNVEGFANGYDTVVGERGVTLSGGQKQRVAIARTLIRGTPYMIFDDSLSAVDSDTDAKIRAQLRKECK